MRLPAGGDVGIVGWCLTIVSIIASGVGRPANSTVRAPTDSGKVSALPSP